MDAVCCSTSPSCHPLQGPAAAAAVTVTMDWILRPVAAQQQREAEEVTKEERHEEENGEVLAAHPPSDTTDGSMSEDKWVVIQSRGSLRLPATDLRHQASSAPHSSCDTEALLLFTQWHRFTELEVWYAPTPDHEVKVEMDDGTHDRGSQTLAPSSSVSALQCFSCAGEEVLRALCPSTVFRLPPLGTVSIPRQSASSPRRKRERENGNAAPAEGEDEGASMALFAVDASHPHPEEPLGKEEEEEGGAFVLVLDIPEEEEEEQGRAEATSNSPLPSPTVTLNPAPVAPPSAPTSPSTTTPRLNLKRFLGSSDSGRPTEDAREPSAPHHQEHYEAERAAERRESLPADGEVCMKEDELQPSALTAAAFRGDATAADSALLPSSSEFALISMSSAAEDESADEKLNERDESSGGLTFTAPPSSTVMLLRHKDVKDLIAGAGGATAAANIMIHHYVVHYEPREESRAATLEEEMDLIRLRVPSVNSEKGGTTVLATRTDEVGDVASALLPHRNLSPLSWCPLGTYCSLPTANSSTITSLSGEQYHRYQRPILMQRCPLRWLEATPSTSIGRATAILREQEEAVKQEPEEEQGDCDRQVSSGVSSQSLTISPLGCFPQVLEQLGCMLFWSTAKVVTAEPLVASTSSSLMWRRVRLAERVWRCREGANGRLLEAWPEEKQLEHRQEELRLLPRYFVACEAGLSLVALLDRVLRIVWREVRGSLTALTMESPVLPSSFTAATSATGASSQDWVLPVLVTETAASVSSGAYARFWGPPSSHVLHCGDEASRGVWATSNYLVLSPDVLTCIGLEWGKKQREPTSSSPWSSTATRALAHITRAVLYFVSKHFTTTAVMAVPSITFPSSVSSNLWDRDTEGEEVALRAGLDALTVVCLQQRHHDSRHNRSSRRSSSSSRRGYDIHGFLEEERIIDRMAEAQQRRRLRLHCESDETTPIVSSTSQLRQCVRRLRNVFLQSNVISTCLRCVAAGCEGWLWSSSPRSMLQEIIVWWCAEGKQPTPPVTVMPLQLLAQAAYRVGGGSKTASTTSLSQRLYQVHAKVGVAVSLYHFSTSSTTTSAELSMPRISSLRAIPLVGSTSNERHTIPIATCQGRLTLRVTPGAPPEQLRGGASTAAAHANNNSSSLPSALRRLPTPSSAAAGFSECPLIDLHLRWDEPQQERQQKKEECHEEGDEDTCSAPPQLIDIPLLLLVMRLDLQPGTVTLIRSLAFLVEQQEERAAGGHNNTPADAETMIMKAAQRVAASLRVRVDQVTSLSHSDFVSHRCSSNSSGGGAGIQSSELSVLNEAYRAAAAASQGDDGATADGATNNSSLQKQQNSRSSRRRQDHRDPLAKAFRAVEKGYAAAASTSGAGGRGRGGLAAGPRTNTTSDAGTSDSSSNPYLHLPIVMLGGEPGTTTTPMAHNHSLHELDSQSIDTMHCHHPCFHRGARMVWRGERDSSEGGVATNEPLVFWGAVRHAVAHLKRLLLTAPAAHPSGRKRERAAEPGEQQGSDMVEEDGDSLLMLSTVSAQWLVWAIGCRVLQYLAGHLLLSYHDRQAQQTMRQALRPLLDADVETDAPLFSRAAQVCLHFNSGAVSCNTRMWLNRMLSHLVLSAATTNQKAKQPSVATPAVSPSFFLKKKVNSRSDEEKRDESDAGVTWLSPLQDHLRLYQLAAIYFLCPSSLLASFTAARAECLSMSGAAASVLRHRLPQQDGRVKGSRGGGEPLVLGTAPQQQPPITATAFSHIGDGEDAATAMSEAFWYGIMYPDTRATWVYICGSTPTKVTASHAMVVVPPPPHASSRSVAHTLSQWAALKKEKRQEAEVVVMKKEREKTAIPLRVSLSFLSLPSSSPAKVKKEVELADGTPSEQHYSVSSPHDCLRLTAIKLLRDCVDGKEDVGGAATGEEGDGGSGQLAPLIDDYRCLVSRSC